jgi:hypothetical protein
MRSIGSRPSSTRSSYSSTTRSSGANQSERLLRRAFLYRLLRHGRRCHRTWARGSRRDGAARCLPAGLVVSRRCAGLRSGVPSHRSHGLGLLDLEDEDAAQAIGDAKAAVQSGTCRHEVVPMQLVQPGRSARLSAYLRGDRSPRAVDPRARSSSRAHARSRRRRRCLVRHACPFAIAWLRALDL